MRNCVYVLIILDWTRQWKGSFKNRQMPKRHFANLEALKYLVHWVQVLGISRWSYTLKLRSWPLLSTISYVMLALPFGILIKRKHSRSKHDDHKEGKTYQKKPKPMKKKETASMMNANTRTSPLRKTNKRIITINMSATSTHQCQPCKAFYTAQRIMLGYRRWNIITGIKPITKNIKVDNNLVWIRLVNYIYYVYSVKILNERNKFLKTRKYNCQIHEFPILVFYIYLVDVVLSHLMTM